MQGEPSAPGGVVSERQVRCALDVAAAAWLLEAGDLEGARRVLESALGIVPHDVRARTMLARVLFRMRDFIAASELYERLLSEFRGDLALTFNLALCHLKSGRPDAAASGLRHILGVRPDHARARVWLRVAEAATGVDRAARSADAPSVGPVAAAPSTSLSPNRLEELPRVTLPPGTSVAKDATGVVSVRVDGATRWLARRDALQGYSGEVAVDTRAAAGDGASALREARSAPLVSLSGSGTAFLRAKEALVVIELRDDEETCLRASSLVAYASTLTSEAADPEVVGEFDEDILRFSGAGALVLEARADLVALPVSLTHATTVRWDNVIGWTGHVIGAPSDCAGPDGRALARFAGNGSLLLAMHDEGASVPVVQGQEWYGRYEVLRRLEGTKAEEILLARAHGPGGFQRKVILKRHLVRCDRDSRVLQVLAEEAHSYALLTHPGIVRLYDFLLLDGHPVRVLEYVSGVSLGAMGAALQEQDRAVGDQVALYIAHGVFSALAAAHGAREPDTGELAPVLHGDLHPGSVLLGWNGDVKLANFATTKVVADGASALSAARFTPEVDGPGPASAGYLAPEKLRGDPLTASTDVYVASLLLYEMLTNRRAFDPSLPEIVLQLAMARPSLEDLDTLRPELGNRLRDALRIALATQPENRRVSAADLACAIEAAVDLRIARKLCVEELASLRESAFASMTRTSRPPEAATDGEDAELLRMVRLPKASPLPVIAPAAWPTAVSVASDDASDVEAPPAPLSNVDRDAHGAGAPSAGPSLAAVVFLASDAPPSIQPPSWGPTEAGVDAPRIFKGRRRAAVAIGLSAVAVAAGVAAVVWAPRSSSAGHAAASEVAVAATRSISEATPPAPAPAASRVDGAARSADAPSTTASPPPAIAPVVVSDEGTLHTPPRAAQHRIYVDGRVVGEGSGDFQVRCGAHSVRVGSKGDDRRIEIPCGGSIAVE